MPLNVRRRTLVCEKSVAECEKCQKVYFDGECYCPDCGSKLSVQKAKIYANYGKRGLTSYTIKYSNGVSFNTKGTMTLPLAEGISYTSKL